MRSFKYHDYRGVRIVIFLILIVVLLLLVYKQFIEAPLDHSEHDFKWVTEKEATCLEDGTRYKLCKEHDEKFGYESIPATGHTPAVAVREKDRAATCTAGGSYDLVIYCQGCGIELERETVQVEQLPHTPGTATKTNNVNPSHASNGGYDMVTKCTGCSKVLKTEHYTVDALGHNYDHWEIVDVNGNPNSVKIKGECACSEEGYVIYKSISDGVRVEKDSSKNVPCVANWYVISYTYGGETITLYHEFHSTSHAVSVYEIAGVGKVYIYADSVAYEDEVYGKYYVLGTEGIELVLDPDNGYTEDNVWDENGFAVGLYKCPICNGYVSVNLYSAERDTRLNTDSEN